MGKPIRSRKNRTVNIKDELGVDIFNIFRKELKLTMKEVVFVHNYLLNGFNAADAYRKALGTRKLSTNSVCVRAHKLIIKDNIRLAIQKIMNFYIGECKIRFEKQIIDQLQKRAFYDVSMFVNPDGSPKFSSWDEIPQEYRCCVDGIETKYYGKDADVQAVVFKMADRNKALLELSKYIALYQSTLTVEAKLDPATEEKLRKLFDKNIDNKV